MASLWDHAKGCVPLGYTAMTTFSKYTNNGERGGLARANHPPGLSFTDHWWASANLDTLDWWGGWCAISRSQVSAGKVSQAATFTVYSPLGAACHQPSKYTSKPPSRRAILEPCSHADTLYSINIWSKSLNTALYVNGIDEQLYAILRLLSRCCLRYSSKVLPDNWIYG